MVWGLEFGACMDELSSHGHGGRQLHEYLQDFVWPKAYASGRDICKGSVQERAIPKDVRPAGSASELISVGPVVAKWLTDVVMVAGICPAHVTALLLCRSVQYRSSSWSLAPRVMPNDLAMYVPVTTTESVQEGDRVFCEVQPGN